MRRLTIAVFLLGICAPTLSCASYVRKRELSSVKKVAILSVFGNQRIGSKQSGDYCDDWNEALKEKVTGMAYQAFAEEFKKAGWRVVSPQKVTDSPDYLNAFRDIRKDSLIGPLFAKKGMEPIALDESSRMPASKQGNPKERYLSALSRMAKRLGVDAVAIVELRFCYRESQNLLGDNNQAVISVDSALKLVGKDGVLIVDMPAIEGCGKHAVDAAGGFDMFGGKFVLSMVKHGAFSELTEKLFSESAEKTMNRIKQEIQ